MMFAGDRAGASRSARNPLPPKLAALLREAWWFALLGVAILLFLVLYTYDKSDPGWSHSVAASEIRNTGGVIGAYLADLLLFVFGMSAYWWVVFCAVLVWLGFRRIETVTEFDRRSYAVAAIGFLVVLIASSGIEAIRLHTVKAILPLAPGGMLGALVGEGLARALGFTGGTLVLLLLLAAGLGLFAGVSWLIIIERIGGWVEDASLLIGRKWQEHADRKAGEQA